LFNFLIYQSWRNFVMGKSSLLCVLLGTLAWGQAQAPMTPTPPAAQAAGAPSQPAAPPAEVAESAVVLTIKGVCKPVAVKTAAGATKTASAKKPADCKTEITRAEFEKIASGLSPNVTPQLKRQLETALPRFMAMSEAAKEQGLQNSPRYKQTLEIAKMQILTQELQRSLQEKADRLTPDEIKAYYEQHPDAYEQFSLDRLFIPRYKTVEAEEKDDMEEVKDKDDKDKDKGKDKDDAKSKEPEKLTEEQQKAKEAEDQAKREKGEQELNKLADSLREKAAAGEDFTKLQKEAFEASGTKVENPTVNLPKVRRTGLPPAHAAVFDLKVGEVSTVISDNGGHYIYKVESKQVLPLDETLTTEIHNKLKTEHLKEMTDKYTNSFQAIPNEAYFGAAMPPGRPGMGGTPPPHMRPGMPMPPQGQPQGAPPAGNPPGQAAAPTPAPTPAPQAPSAKPN
jgi:hypothetical protein